jgi:hypothetical protein
LKGNGKRDTVEGNEDRRRKERSIERKERSIESKEKKNRIRRSGEINVVIG